MTKWLICDEMNQLTLDFVTYSWQWGQMFQLLLKKFFYISYGFVCDEMTHLWRNEPINTRFCNIFLTVRSNVPTFVKELFYISYGLVCDEMTNLWRNEPINTKSCNLLVKLGSNVTTFCKEVFWYLLRIRRYRILQSLMV